MLATSVAPGAAAGPCFPVALEGEKGRKLGVSKVHDLRRCDEVWWNADEMQRMNNGNRCMSVGLL